MKYSAIFTAFLATAVMASPVDIADRGYPTTTTTTPAGYPTTTTTTPAGYPTTSSTPPTTSSTPGGGGGYPTTSSSSPGSYPTGGGGSGGGNYVACSGLYSQAQCCATDVLGLADLDCHAPGTTLTSASNFRATCAAIGQRARCCVIPILGQALLCQSPVGV